MFDEYSFSANCAFSVGNCPPNPFCGNGAGVGACIVGVLVNSAGGITNIYSMTRLSCHGHTQVVCIRMSSHVVINVNCKLGWVG